MTIQESFLAGVPVIASAHGGMAELVRDGVNGLTFRPRDAADLRVKMQQLLDSDKLRKQLRPDREEIKDVENSAEEHLDLYRELLRTERERASAGISDEQEVLA